MNTNQLNELFGDKTIKPKEKTETISNLLLNETLNIDELIDFAVSSKEPVKASCIEAIEYATKLKPEIADINCFYFVINSLSEKSPRVKWESARVIGNIAYKFPKEIEKALPGLLANTENQGTVVRWSSAYALGQIIKCKLSLNNGLIPTINAVCDREEKNSIKKIYLEALKKIQK